MEFMNKAGVSHGDLTTANVLLNENFEAKLVAFAGSSLDSSPLFVTITSRHEHPRELLLMRADSFAFVRFFMRLLLGGNRLQTWMERRLIGIPEG